MNVTLYIPGLFGPAARFSEDYIPRAESLEFLLGRAQQKRASPSSYHVTLCRLFDLETPPDQDVPVAAITHQIDADEYAPGCWMRADPVHLRADRHGLILLDARALNLDIRDALALAAELRGLVEARGWQLEVPHPERWYLRLDARPALRTRELDEVVGGNVAGALPAGEDAARWHGVLNEIQMQLHSSEVNRSRESRGMPAVNSLWLWGIGDAPPAPRPRWWKVYSDEFGARAFARFGGIPSAPMAPSLRDLSGTGAGAAPILVVADACKRCVEIQDLEGWHNVVCAFEEHWFDPAAQMLRSGVLRTLELDTGDRRFVITRPSLYFFWRRPAPLAAHMGGA
ncbi:MAG: hypothetical protein HYY48_03880 [Gammaproteobacteria bacterium]|nr:hypothetical protein [Gammaproteobacteria bacterium]